MKHTNCPICYSNLGIRDVTPCYVCGGWDGELERYSQDTVFTEYYLESGKYITLCESCWLEELLALQGDLVSDLNLPISKGAASGYTLSNRSVDNKIVKDKYCSTCNKRLALLKIINPYETKS